MDFVDGVDKLDFSKMDANTAQSGVQDFVFDGYRSSGSGSTGHLWAVEDSDENVTHLYGQTGTFRFDIVLQGADLGLSSGDFIL